MIDLILINECKKGNLSKFRELIGKSIPFAYSVAFRMTGDDDQAKDIVQESMITIWKKLEKIRSSESFKTWLYKIVINKCYDYLRKRKRLLETKIDEKTWKILSDNIPEEYSSELENNEIACLINVLSQKLSPKQKAVFVLSDIEEMTNGEISAITGLTKENVKSNLYHARKRVSEMIKKFI